MENETKVGDILIEPKNELRYIKIKDIDNAGNVEFISYYNGVYIGQEKVDKDEWSIYRRWYITPAENAARKVTERSESNDIDLT
jgi:hypothetical protein